MGSAMDLTYPARGTRTHQPSRFKIRLQEDRGMVAISEYTHQQSRGGTELELETRLIGETGETDETGISPER